MVVYIDPETIHDPAPGEIPPSTWGLAINDDLEYLVEMPYCSLANTTGTAVPDSTSTRLIPLVEKWDEFAMHSTATNSTRINILEPGIYNVRAAVQWPGDVDGYRLLQVHFVSLGGAPFARAVFSMTAGSGDGLVQNGTVPLRMTVGDYAEITVWHNSGASMTVLMNEFTVKKIARYDG